MSYKKNRNQLEMFCSLYFLVHMNVCRSIEHTIHFGIYSWNNLAWKLMRNKLQVLTRIPQNKFWKPNGTRDHSSFCSYFFSIIAFFVFVATIYLAYQTFNQAFNQIFNQTLNTKNLNDENTEMTEESHFIIELLSSIQTHFESTTFPGPFFWIHFRNSDKIIRTRRSMAA